MSVIRKASPPVRMETMPLDPVSGLPVVWCGRVDGVGWFRSCQRHEDCVDDRSLDLFEMGQGERRRHKVRRTPAPARLTDGRKARQPVHVYALGGLVAVEWAGQRFTFSKPRAGDLMATVWIDVD